MSLGNGNYRVRILTSMDGTLVTDLTPYVVRGTWQHSENSIGVAEVELYGMSGGCCDLVADVRAWVHELEIIRDDCAPFQGPISSISLASDGTLKIRAADVLAWLQVRFVHDDINPATVTTTTDAAEVKPDTDSTTTTTSVETSATETVTTTTVVRTVYVGETDTTTTTTDTTTTTVGGANAGTTTTSNVSESGPATSVTTSTDDNGVITRTTTTTATDATTATTTTTVTTQIIGGDNPGTTTRVTTEATSPVPATTGTAASTATTTTPTKMRADEWACKVIASALKDADPRIRDQVICGECATLVDSEIKKADYVTAWDALQPLLGSVINITTYGRQIIVSCAGECLGELGRITSESIAETFTVERRGIDFVTRAVVKGSSDDPKVAPPVYEAGGVNAWSGVLVERRYDDATATATSAESIAKGKLVNDEPLATARDADATIVLDCNSPIDGCSVFPGMCFTLVIDNCFGVSVRGRITTVGADWDSTGENFQFAFREVLE